MKLYLHNIGKVGEAEIAIDGITVIAGENNTGKSTIGKALFAVFNAFYDVERRIEEARIDSMQNVMLSLRRRTEMSYTRSIELNHLIRSLVENRSTPSVEELSEELSKFLGRKDDETEDAGKDTAISMAQNIIQSLKLDDDTVFALLMRRRLNAEFNAQVTNLYSTLPGRICLTIQNSPVTVSIDQDGHIAVDQRLDLHTEAIYLDDPFVLDEVFYRTRFSISNHRNHLIWKMQAERDEAGVVSEFLTGQRLENIYGMVSSICAGDIVLDRREGSGYRIPGQDVLLDVKNLSTGLKTFAILKRLLMNGSVEENGIIILDEPEIHLHPEWQLLLAELIVLLHREFGLHVLLNTHSPYFLNAIEVYSARHGVSDKCRYYLSRDTAEGAYFDDVTGELERVYCQLARPLQELENQRYAE